MLEGELRVSYLRKCVVGCCKGARRLSVSSGKCLVHRSVANDSIAAWRGCMRDALRSGLALEVVKRQSSQTNIKAHSGNW